MKPMKKLSITLLCLLASYSFTQAGIFQFGPRLGISRSEISLADKNHTFQISPTTGYQAGVVTRINLPLVYIQPELVITQSGASYQFQGKEETLSYTKLELPIMVGMGFLGLARIQVGPHLGLLWRAKAGKQDVRSDYENLSLGYQVGLGTDIWKLIIDLKYEGGLTKFGSKLSGISIDHKPSSLILSIGYNLI